MILRPESRDELCRWISEASSKRERLGRCDLSGLSRVIEYAPEDMTVTVEAGMKVCELQAVLKKSGQWLAIDPPGADSMPVEELISANLSGPRRFGYGTVRDMLIGLRAILGDGSLIHSGGKVVKNVAGYDVQKLFVGGHGTLGVIVEATFKVRPLPESECVVHAVSETNERASQLIESVAESELMPVIFDWHQLRASFGGGSMVVLGFEGSREEVEWQREKAAELGFGNQGGLEGEDAFWVEGRRAYQTLSVLPSSTVETVRDLKPESFVARAGNGVIYYRGGRAPGARSNPAAHLEQRVKDVFDPNRVFADLSSLRN